MNLPSEVLDKIFSYLPYTVLYRMRIVCTAWKAQCEHSIYTQLKASEQKIVVKVGEKDKTFKIELEPTFYDYENSIVEFKPVAPMDTYVGNSKEVKLIFTEWQRKINPAIKALDLSDRALAMFHLEYNASLERVYLLPDVSDEEEIRYMGDKGMVMCFYLAKDGNVQFETVSGDVDQHMVFDNLALPTRPIRFVIQSVQVNIAWLLAGMVGNTERQDLYPYRYDRLKLNLARCGVRKFYPYTEAALEYIMSDRNALNRDELNNFTAVKSRREDLENELVSAGIDPSVMYKYTFAKIFLLEGGAFSFEETIQRIKAAEQDWNTRKLKLNNKLK